MRTTCSSVNFKPALYKNIAENFENILVKARLKYDLRLQQLLPLTERDSMLPSLYRTMGARNAL